MGDNTGGMVIGAGADRAEKMGEVDAEAVAGGRVSDVVRRAVVEDGVGLEVEMETELTERVAAEGSEEEDAALGEGGGRGEERDGVAGEGGCRGDGDGLLDTEDDNDARSIAGNARPRAERDGSRVVEEDGGGVRRASEGSSLLPDDSSTEASKLDGTAVASMPASFTAGAGGVTEGVVASSAGAVMPLGSGSCRDCACSMSTRCCSATATVVVRMGCSLI